jgi:Amt family ammonium transporter
LTGREQRYGLTGLALVVLVGVAFTPESIEPMLFWSLATGALALLVPIGLALLTSGGLAEEQAVPAALMGLVAVGLAASGYLLTGFALQFGGIGLFTTWPGLEKLVWEWSLVDVAWGPGWGMAGLRGFLLGQEAYNPAAYALFFSQLAPLATAVLIPMLALRGRVRPFVLVTGVLLVSMVTYPLAGNWVWGGGWLAHLGENLALGHGFIDFAGAGMVNWLGGLIALAGLLVFGAPLNRGQLMEGPARMPPVHLPIFAILGALLTIVGWFGLATANPLHLSGDVSLAVVAVNILLAASGGTLLALFYAWFTLGRANVLLVSRGLVAALVAISATCPFVPAWAAFIIGAVAGLLLPLSIYLIEYGLGLDDATAAVSVHAISGLWGLLALGIFADGTYGLGWNGVGTTEYLGIAGQGVSGYLTASGFQPDPTGQLYAQLIGAVALGLFAFVLAWLLFRVLTIGLTRSAR